MEFVQTVAIHTMQKVYEYHEYAANNFRTNAFQAWIPPAQRALRPHVYVRRGDQNMPMFMTPSCYEIVNGIQ